MNSSQLSLFNTSAATGHVYRAGDWVKVRKKPAIAAWVKRGEVFQINQVHPIDGSLKFWNPHIKQWDFLYPEEVKLTVEPVVGEASELTVEPVVGEASDLTVEPVVGEASELTVESVVGEIPKLTVESVVGEVSESIVESVVGEVKTPKNYWNCDKGDSGNGWLESHYKIRRGGKQHSINWPEIKCTGPYYSYRWMEGKRQRAKYCPESKCPAVRKALAIGQPVSEILKIISSYKI
ncbi:hypothetical protein Q5692_35635 [Microcoleus sp. C2C3]|uniref:hypothetical protein n=1 Tax=unclassified Microcoleus TaxID=2642155 RepID=UPI002FD4F48F